MSSSESDYFDTFVSREGEFDPFQPRGWRTLRRRFDEMVPLPGPLRMLDIGCGTGQSRLIYHDRASSFTGIDLSRVALSKAKSKFPASGWLQADAFHLPFRDAAFDVVSFSSVLHHLPELEAPLREAYRAVRPGGYVFAYDPNLRHPAMALLRHPRSPLYLTEGVSPNERPLLPSELDRAFADAGFDDVRQRCVSDIPFKKVAPRLVNSLLSLYNAVDWLAEKIGLGRWLGSFVLTTGRRPESPVAAGRP